MENNGNIISNVNTPNPAKNILAKSVSSNESKKRKKKINKFYIIEVF